MGEPCERPNVNFRSVTIANGGRMIIDAKMHTSRNLAVLGHDVSVVKVDEKVGGQSAVTVAVPL